MEEKFNVNQYVNKKEQEAQQYYKEMEKQAETIKVKLGKPYNNKIGGRELIGVKLYVENKAFFINIDKASVYSERPEIWLKEDKQFIKKKQE